MARGHFVAVPAPMELGIINYRHAIRWALANGFQGVICTEHYGGDGLSISATNQSYLREKLLPKVDGYALGRSRVKQMDWLVEPQGRSRTVLRSGDGTAVVAGTNDLMAQP